MSRVGKLPMDVRETTIDWGPAGTYSPLGVVVPCCRGGLCGSLGTRAPCDEWLATLLGTFIRYRGPQSLLLIRFGR